MACAGLLTRQNRGAMLAPMSRGLLCSKTGMSCAIQAWGTAHGMSPLSLWFNSSRRVLPCTVAATTGAPSSPHTACTTPRPVISTPVCTHSTCRPDRAHVANNGMHAGLLVPQQWGSLAVASPAACMVTLLATVRQCSNMACPVPAPWKSHVAAILPGGCHGHCPHCSHKSASL